MDNSKFGLDWSEIKAVLLDPTLVEYKQREKEVNRVLLEKLSTLAPYDAKCFLEYLWNISNGDTLSNFDYHHEGGLMDKMNEVSFKSMLSELYSYFREAVPHNETATPLGASTPPGKKTGGGGNRGRTFDSFFINANEDLDYVKQNIPKDVDDSTLADYFDCLVRKGKLHDIPTYSALKSVGVSVSETNWKALCNFRRRKR